MHAEWRLEVSLFGHYFRIFIQSKIIITFYEICKIPPAKMHAPSLLRYTILTVLGQLPQKKIAPNPKTNPNSNPNSNRGVIFLGGNCLVDPQS